MSAPSHAKHPAMNRYQLFIGNEWTDSSTGAWFESLDPFSGKPWALIPRGNARDVERAVDAAARTLESPWSQLSATNRGMLLLKLAALIEKNIDLLTGVWTKSLHRAMLMSEKLKAGTVWINNYRSTSFTTPFGGYKNSAIGREGGMDAVKEFLEVKSVWVSSDLDMPDPFVRKY